MIITILDSNLKKISLLRNYIIARYENRFNLVSRFTILANMVDENMYLLDKDKEYFVLFNDEEFGKITYVGKSGDSDYPNTLEISGLMATSILEDRVVNGTLNFTNAYTYEIVKELIRTQLVESSDSSRNINMTFDLDEEELQRKCSIITNKQITGGYVYDECYDYLQQDKLGVLIKPNVTPLQNGTNIPSFTCVIKTGEDRTKGNPDGNEPIIFSQMLSNISRTEYSRKTEFDTSVAYVAGEENEDEDRKWFTVYKGQERKSGWNLRELWIDARDIQSEDEDGNVISDDEYEALIHERAEEKFAANSEEEEYSATITEHINQYMYGVDFNLGDFVTIMDNELNLIVNAQVTCATYTIQEGKEILDIDFTYGTLRDDDIVVDLADSENNIEVNKNNISFVESFAKKIINGILNFAGHLLPKSDNTYDVGSTSKKWRMFYASAGYQSYAGSESSAFSHTHSRSGKRISMGVGSGGTNRGLYDNSTKNWMLYYDDSKINLTKPTIANGTFEVSSTSHLHGVYVYDNTINVRRTGFTRGTKVTSNLYADTVNMSDKDGKALVIQEFATYTSGDTNFGIYLCRNDNASSNTYSFLSFSMPYGSTNPKAYFNGRLGVGTSASDSYNLYVNGTAYATNLYATYSSSSKSVAAKTWTTVQTSTLSAGHWIISFSAYDSSTSSGRLLITCTANASQSSAATPIGFDNSSRTSATSTFSYTFSASTTLYFRVYNDSSAAKTIYYAWSFARVR